MCSMADARLNRIGEAIDAVAEAARADADEITGMADLTSRLAAIWDMVAELDPALAASLLRYTRDA